MKSEEYNLWDGDAPVDDTDNVDESNDPQVAQDEDDDKAEKPEEDVDPTLADWLKVDQDKGPIDQGAIKDDSDTETDQDSENEDMRQGGLDDDWYNIGSTEEHSESATLSVRFAFYRSLLCDG
jgi:hypothetical protein